LINHLILLSEEQSLHVADGKLISGNRKIAIETLGSVQCLSAASQWSQTALELLATQCPVVLARWDKQQKKWRTFSLTPKARYVNPTALWKLCRLSPQRATQLASGLLWTKVCNQHQMLHTFDPRLTEKPQLKENSFNRILRLEATYARFFWPRYFSALATDLFEREHRKPTHPINARSITATAFYTTPSSGNVLPPALIQLSASFTNCVATAPASPAI
jgi:CRISPR/Cas system-associated endonuclease Cas1